MPASSIFNVRDFGAVGGGVVDDRAAIQRACDAAYAAGGGIVYLPAGVYGLSGAGFTSTYAGIQIRSNVTVAGDGIGATIIKVLDGSSSGFTGILRTPVGEETHDVTIRDLSIDGNRANTTGKVDGFFCGTEPGAGTHVSDISLLAVEVMNCSGYGIDPHEQSLRTTIENCISHGNGLDGFTLDFQVDAIVRGNVAYDNDRHGFNIVTQSHDVLLQNNTAYGNGSSGMVVQRGSENVPSPYNIVIQGGAIYDNMDGVLIKMANDVKIDGVHIYENGREGVKVYGSSDVEITHSTIENNSQLLNNGYSQIYITAYSDSLTGRLWLPADNIVVDNTIASTGEVQPSYGIRETADASGSIIRANDISGAVRGDTFTGPQAEIAIPDLHAPVDAFHYTIPKDAFIDIDRGDHVSLDLRLADSGGALIGDGSLPEWLTFDAARGVISGAPPSAQTVHLMVTATDLSGAQEHDAFSLTTSPTGVHNVEAGASAGDRVFNVRDYGAYGDGVHVDRAAIQKAVDAAYAAGGGTVYVPAGVYIIANGSLNKSDAGIQMRSNVTLTGDGMGQTVLRVAAGNNKDITGVVRTPFGEETHNVTVSNLTIDGNRDANSSGKVDGLYCGTAPGSTEQDSDITFSRIEILDCSGYGFDPHEQTLRLTIEDCVSHGNGLDGFTLDYLIDSRIVNNVAYDNDRHGFNVVTSTYDTLLQNNVAYGNGGNGITVQRGGEDIPSPHGITIIGGEIYGNRLAGILLQMSDEITVEDVSIHDNGREGIKVFGSSDVTITDSQLSNNSQSANGAYSEISLVSFADPVTSRTWTTSGTVITGNTISETAAVRAGYGVRESLDTTGSLIDGNTITGVTKAATLTGPQIREQMPDLQLGGQAFSYVIPGTAYVDVDAGDTVTLALQRVTANGALLDGGQLPSWISFDPATRTLSGAAPANTDQTFYFRIAASDRAGDVEYDRFSVDVTSGAPNYSTAPVVANPIADQIAQPSQAFTFAVPRNAFFDADLGDSLTFTAAAPDGTALPSWLSFDGSTGAFSGTPGQGDFGSLQVRVTATDRGGSSVSDVFAIAVGEVEDPPIVARPLGDQTAVMGQPFTYAIPAGSFTDADPGDTLTLTATLADGGPLPSWLAFDPQTATFSGTPATGDPTTLDIRVTATDRTGARVSDDFHLGVGAGVNQTGTEGDDVLTGSAGPDQLWGLGGADRIDGGGGADQMTGGDGDDVYVVDDAGDAVVEFARNGLGGIDRVESWISYVLPGDVENLTLLGAQGLNATGNNKGNAIIGNAGANIIDGGLGNDTMSGGAGDDTYHVGQSSDVVIELAGEGVDTVISALAYTLGDNVEDLQLIGTALTGNGNGLANRIIGNDSANKLSGVGGDDILDGGLGADALYGGAGDDTYYVDADDNVVELAGEGYDTVYSDATLTLKANVERLILTGSAAADGIGNGADNSLVGNAAANRLEGAAGADRLQGGGGGDTLVGGSGADTFVYADLGDSAGTNLDTVLDFKPGEGDRIDVSAIDADAAVAGRQDFVWRTAFTGRSGEVQTSFDSASNRTTLSFDADGDRQADMAIGLAGRVTGLDWLIGAVSPSTATAPVVAQPLEDRGAEAGQAFAYLIPADAFTDADPGDELTLTAARADGQPLPSWLTFDATTATFSGTPASGDLGAVEIRVTATDLGGNNVSDVFVVDVGEANVAPTVAHPLADQSAQAGRPFSLSIPEDAFADANADDMLSLSAVAGDGSPLPAWLTFDATTRTFSGSPSAQDVGQVEVRVTATDRGGLSASDVFAVTIRQANSAPQLAQPIADQNTAVGKTFTYSLPANAFVDPDAGDSLTLSAALANGDPLPTWLSFDPVSRTFSGSAKPGDAGALQISITATDAAGAKVSDTFALTVAAGLALTGTAGADVLEGNIGQDTLNGLAGADHLDGAEGADQMTGGDGNDVFVVDDEGDTVTEFARSGAGGVDRVESAISYALGSDVENLTLTGTADIDATGNNKANIIIGNAGANRIDGGAGNDTMSGGAGDDTYLVRQTGDVVNELPGEGVDTVISAVTYTLKANIENLTLTGSAGTGKGNEHDNILTGNDAANKLYGLAGADTFHGGGGADTLYGGAGNDTYYVGTGDNVVELAGEGDDTVYSAVTFTLKSNVERLILTGSAAVNGIGSSGDNTLIGNTADNRLEGAGGADRLEGGAGGDTLLGGAGADTFVYTLVSDSAVGQSDRILDFKTAEQDRIDVSAIDANSLVDGNQNFAWVQQFDRHAGQVQSTFDAGANLTTLAFDVDGDAQADMSILIQGRPLGVDWLLG